jgi:hypothetical protein
MANWHASARAIRANDKLDQRLRTLESIAKRFGVTRQAVWFACRGLPVPHLRRTGRRNEGRCDRCARLFYRARPVGRYCSPGCMYAAQSADVDMDLFWRLERDGATLRDAAAQLGIHFTTLCRLRRKVGVPYRIARP